MYDAFIILLHKTYKYVELLWGAIRLYSWCNIEQRRAEQNVEK